MCNSRSTPASPSTPKQELGGLVFAKVRTGKLSFAGHVGDAKATLFAGLPPTATLVKNPSHRRTAHRLEGPHRELARDFLAGRAEVDPRDYPKTCERCGLQTLCRIQEIRAHLDAEEDSDEDDAEAADE